MAFDLKFPPEMGQFFARATRMIDNADGILTEVRAAAKNVNTASGLVVKEIQEWQAIRERLFNKT